MTILPTAVWAFKPAIGKLEVEPDGVFTLISTQVMFVAPVARDSKHLPNLVRLLRLQADGSALEVCRMGDDGSHGDEKAGDGIYTCVLTLKEPLAGMLSFNVEATYPGVPNSVQAHPIFMNVVGGATKKEKKAVLKTQEAARTMLKRLQKEKGPAQAKKDTMAWLTQQPTVSGVVSAPGQDIFIQYKAGATFNLRANP